MRPIIGITCSLTARLIGGSSSYFSQYHTVSCDFAKAIENAKGVPIFLPHSENRETIEHYLSTIDGLLLSSGGDLDALLFGEEPHPKIGEVDQLRDRMELDLIRKALDRSLPILGICRGIQVLNVAFGGTICQDIPSEIPDSKVSHAQKGAGDYASHTIDIVPGTILHSIVGSTIIAVNSFHHQAVGKIGDGLIASAFAKDGVVEAIEGDRKNGFVVGVEYHPELMWKTDRAAERLFVEFVKACDKSSKSRKN